MSSSASGQMELATCQQRVAVLEAELAQTRSHLATLQHKNESLRRSESRYRQIFENAPISVFLAATDGTLTEMNTAAEKFFGFTIAQAQTHNLNCLTDSNLVENGTSTSAQRAIAGETVIEPPMSFDPTSTIGRGQWKWAQGHYYPIRDETGQVQEVAEIALDLTPMYEVQQRLSQERTQLLNTIAQVANLLLRGSIGTASQTPDYTAVLPDVVRLLGEAVGSDRCTVGQDEIVDGNTVSVRAIAEWCRIGVSSALDIHPEFEEGVEPFAEIYQPLSQGESVNVLVSDLAEPVRSFMAQQGIMSLLLVPILAKGKSWGHFAFDNCGEARLFDEAEIAVLKIAADSIVAAIERQAKDNDLRSAQQTLLQAEYERSQELECLNGELQQAIERLENRDCILEATATAANTLLTTQNLDTAVNTAFQILGEALNTDRIAIMENFDPSPDAMFPSYRGLYEWDSPQTVSQISHPVAGEGTYADIEWLYELFRQGQSASYQIEDAPEPFRSEQLDIGVKSTHLVPIYIEGRWWGVLGLDDCLEAKHRSLAELAVLRTAAACLGSAIQRDRSQKAVLQAEQQRVAELASANAALQAEIIERRRAEQVSRGQTEALVRTLNTLAQEPVLDNCLGYMLQAIADQFSDRSGGIYLYSEEYDTTLLHLNYENGQIQRGKEIQHPCAHTPEPLRQWDDEFIPLLRQRQILIQDVGHYPHNIDRGIKQILVVPLLFGDTFLGNITLRSTTHRQYQPEELELAQAFAYQVTLAVQLTRLAEEAKQTAVAKLNEVIAREQEKAALERAAELTKINEELQQRGQEVQQSYRLLAVIAEVTQDLLHNSQVEEAIVQALQQIGEAANISRVTLMQEKLEVSSGRLQHHVIQEWVASGISRQMDDPITRVMYSDEYGAICDELRAGRSIWYVIEDLPEPIQTEQIGIAVKSTGAVPIFIEGEYFGCVGFDDCIDHRQWTSQEVDVLTSSAGAIGAALHRKQLVDRLVAERIQAEQERAAELAKNNQALKNSIDRLAADPDLNGFLGHVVLEIIEQLNLYTAWVELYDPTAQTLQMHLLVEGGTLHLKPTLPDRGHLTQGYPAQNNVAWNQLLQTRQPLVITLETLPQFFTGDDLEMQVQWAQQCGIQCGINLLLMLGDEPLGILVLFSTDRTAFSREELELAQALVQQATLAIQLTRLAEGAKQSAILEERNRMARELHDSLAQSLTGVVMQLNAATEFLTVQPDQTQTCITRAQELAKQGLAEARRSVWLLYDNHLAAGDLSSALKKLVEQTSLTTNTIITLEINGVSRLLEAPVCLNLLRIAQESLTNALRHAHPQTIHLHLTYLESQIHLQICDDGCGFHPEQSRGKGFGLTGMSDRAKAIGAQLQIQSKLGIGTQTIATVAIAPR